MLSIFEKQSTKHNFDFQKQLRSIPVANKHVNVVSEDDSKIVLAVELKYTGLMKVTRKVFDLNKEKKYELEGIALEVYRMIDGKRPFEKLIDMFKDKYQLTFFEAHSLITQYLGTLMEKGLIVIVASEEL